MTDQVDGLSSDREPPDLPLEARQHFEQASAYDAQGEAEKALHECDLAIQLAPAWAEPHNLRGIVLDEMGRREEAIAAYREAVRLDPALRKAQDNLSRAKSELQRESLQEIKQSIRYLVHRPGWIVAAALWLGATALVWVWGGADALARMDQINWAVAAADLSVEASTFRLLYTIEASWMIATGVIMLASIAGIWHMKKWGTAMYLALVVLIAAGQAWKVVQGQADTLELLFAASLVAIGLGLSRLWRKGELC